MGLVTRVMPPPSAGDYEAMILAALRHQLSLGITSSSDCGVSPALLDVYRAVDANGALPSRVNVMPLRRVDGTPAPLPLPDRFASDRLRVDTIKFLADGGLSGATAAQLTKQPIQYDTGFTLLPGTYSLKFLARDDETGRIGTYLNKFVVPNLNKELKRIPISSVVLSGQRVDMKDSLFTAGKDKMPAVNPLIQNGQKLIPSVTRVFSRSRDMYVYLQAYERGQATMQPLVAFVTFYRGQTKAFETPPLPVTERSNNRLKTAPLRFSLALDKLPAGRYECQVTVLDPASQKAAFWQAPIMLIP